jgi:hypothetical protein
VRHALPVQTASDRIDALEDACRKRLIDDRGGQTGMPAAAEISPPNQAYSECSEILRGDAVDIRTT